MKVKVKTWPHFKGELPQYQSAGASGFDVRAQIDQPIVLKPSERVLIPTGLTFEIPVGFEIQARPRSGWAAKHGLTLMNTPGTIDADYRGEVKVILVNLGLETVTIQDQDRCAQLVICPIIQAQFELATDLSSTERGAGGFGSTGK
ncbi:MAG: dUTP diphosphatase [Bdellovibrionaceae bacterium]|nr:dUTP diphosphatase [Pseudobdellovibrionaceae bacterium]